jgi:hypothetical protein
MGLQADLLSVDFKYAWLDAKFDEFISRDGDFTAFPDLFGGGRRTWDYGRRCGVVVTLQAV